MKAIRIAAVLAAVAAIGGSAPGAGAQPRQIVIKDGVTQPVFSYEDAIRETVYVQSSIDDDLDGSLDLLATDIIRPAETEGGLRVPVIYEQSPYYQDSGRGNEREIKPSEDGDFTPVFFPLYYDNYFVPRGYAVILQDMPGTRNSEGCMVLGGLGELKAGEATVNWLNGDGKAFTATGEEVVADWATGKVGMIGKSYDGSVANGTASTGVPGLTTIVPIAAISRWYDYHLNNGVQYLNAYVTPALFEYLDQGIGDDTSRGLGWVKAQAAGEGYCNVVGTSIVAQAADPRSDYNAFWDERDYLKDVDNVRASVLLIHGLNDYNVKPNNFVAWWEALAKRDVPRKIWLAQMEHIDPFDFRRTEWVTTLHRWFDFWLHGVDNGIMDEPMLDIQRENGRWSREATWPPRNVRKKVLWPTDSGQLVTWAPDAATASFTDDPLQSENTMARNPETPSDSRLAFQTKPLKKDVRISGRMTVSIDARLDRPDTNFTAMLVDYGVAKRVLPTVTTTTEESCHGEGNDQDDPCYLITKQSFQTSAMEIVTRGWLDAKHYADLRMSSPILPATEYTFKWELFGDDYLFKKGHQIGLIIAGSDFDYTIPDPTGATVTVLFGKSRISLPVVGGRRALRF